MNREDIKPYAKVWSMINNSPEEFIVYSVSPKPKNNIYRERFPPVKLLRERTNSIHSRWAEQCFETKEELKKMVFDEL